MFVPLSYNLRSLFVRKSATFLTMLGIAATVGIVAGVLALRAGFVAMFTARGRQDIGVFLRPGATNEGDSQFSRDRGLKLIKSVPEIAVDPEQGPMASMECYLGFLYPRVDGGQTNVPLRGVQPMTFQIRRDELRIVEGRRFTPGTDELIVGRKLVGRVQDCAVGEVLQINTTPFRVVGVFDHDGAFAGEVWGDLDRIMPTVGRFGPNSVIAQLAPGTRVGAPDPGTKVKGPDGIMVEPEPEPGSLAARLKKDREVPAKVLTERQYLQSQTAFLGAVLLGLSEILAVIMGVAAVFTATNTMLSALAARTHEVGILLATGFRPIPIFLSFLFESLLLGLLGGAVGCVLIQPLNGIQMSTMNFNTFTEVTFAFRVTLSVLVSALLFALALGLLGGALPAWRAARLKPTDAIRQA